MKHAPETVGILAEALSAAGLDLPPRAVQALALHLDAVLEANAVQNLTAITDPRQAAELHVVDSLVALPELQRAPPGALADLGSGAGYPGVPLAVASGRPTTLVESVGKKAGFLRTAAASLAPYCNLSIRETRAELLALEMPAAFSVVTARAVSALASLVELSSPLLLEGGVLIALKGPLSEDELARGVIAAGHVGMQLSGTRAATLPGGEKRTIVVFRRTDAVPETPVPRRPGRAQRRPLG